MTFGRLLGSILAILFLTGATGTAVALNTGGNTGPSCGSGQTKHCTLGPPPVCSCITNSVKSKTGAGINTNKNSNTGKSKH